MKQIEESNLRWRYRRRLTWGVMLLYAFVIFYGMFWGTLNIDVFRAILTSITSIVVAVVGSYIGFATYDDVKMREGKKEASMKPDVPEGEVG